MKTVFFGKRKIADYTEPYIIAEIGANHNGDLELAKKMIDLAKEKGADAVKFQSWTKDSIFSKVKYEENYFLADDYREREDYTLESIVDAYSLGKDEHRILKAYCDQVGITFSSTPFAKDEVDFLVDELDVEFIKIASMDLNNIPFLKYVAQKGKPLVLSTGLSTLAEIEEAVKVIQDCGNEELVLLHCVSIYPPDMDQVNLNNIDLLRDVFGCPTGYSDHTLGYGVPILSVAKGVCIIEKHFTLDKEMEGWDHKVSVNPEELGIMIRESKNIYKALGNYQRTVVEPEERIREFRRSIVAARRIEEGQVIQAEDLDYKRPGIGLEPKYTDFIVGKQAKRTIKYDEIIYLTDV